MPDIDRRYGALLLRRTGGDPRAMAAEHAAITARVDALTDPGWRQPTPAQAAAGNYYKPRTRWHGLDIVIENPAGTVREGVDETGRAWRTVFQYAYGEIAGTTGMDGDPVDVYMGPYADAQEVYVVRQMRRKDWGRYDEDKVMLDFPSIEAAQAAYLGHYDDPRFFGGIVAMPIARFLRQVNQTRQRPAMLKSAALLLRVRS